MDITRDSISMESLLRGIAEEYGLSAAWTETDPERISDAPYGRLMAAMRDSAAWDGSMHGYLTVGSVSFRDIKDKSILSATFPVEQIHEIAILRSEGRADAIQIQSVRSGLLEGYRELTVSKSGDASWRLGFFSPKKRIYRKNAV